MSNVIRATKHNARTKKHTNIGFNSKHNDRQFKDEKNLIHTSDNNLYYINGFNYILTQKEYSEWTKEQHKKGQAGTFEEYENLFYTNTFKKQYEIQMEKHIKGGHRERVKTFEEWKSDKRYVPEETILQIGNKDIQIPREKSEDILIEYLLWERNWGYEHKCFALLDFAIHEDETTIHAQSRRVWFSQNEDGIYEIGQAKALERANIPLPDSSKPRSSKNNAKMTFDKLSREKFLEICEAHGVDVERVPIPNAVHDLDKDEMIHRKYAQKERKYAQKEKELSVKEKYLMEEQRSLQSLRNALLDDLQSIRYMSDRLVDESTENGQIRAYQDYLKKIKFKDGSTGYDKFMQSREAEKRRALSRADDIVDRYASLNWQHKDWQHKDNDLDDDFQMR